jgi:glutathione synthase
MLMLAAMNRRHDVCMAGIGDLEASAEGVVAHARTLPARRKSTDTLVASLPKLERTRVDLASCDVVMVRTNPGRARHWLAAHDMALSLLYRVADLGVTVLNHPSALQRAQSKLYLLELPASVIPSSFVSRDVEALEAWVAAMSGPVVLKPARGTRGEDVFLVRPGDRSNVRQIVDVIRREGFVVAQAFVPGAEAGDVRVLVVGGEVLEVDGRAAAVARIPAAGGFRSNIHAGGRPEAAAVSDAMREAVASIKDKLVRDGHFFVGIDFIGSTVIEVNTFSPGGLYDATRHQERDFADAIIQAVEKRIAAA